MLWLWLGGWWGGRWEGGRREGGGGEGGGVGRVVLLWSERGNVGGGGGPGAEGPYE